MVTEAGSVEELRRIAPDIAPSVARLPMPAYILDRNGVVRWLNLAAVKEFGDMRGKRITQIVEPEYATLARQEFAAKLLGTVTATEGTVCVRTAEGRRVEVDISSTQLLQDGSIVGVFGLADPTGAAAAARPAELGASHATAARRPPLRRRRLLDGEHRQDARHLDRDGAEPRSRPDGAPGRAHAPRGRDPRARARARLARHVTGRVCCSMSLA